MKKRPVKIKSYRFNLESQKQETLEFNGIFHEWGNEAVEAGELGFGNFTVGIVEDESGQVHTINPNHIKFLDR